MYQYLLVNVELEIACPLVDRRLKSTDIVRSLSLLAWGLQKCFLNDQATCTVPTLCACRNRRLAIRGPEDNTLNVTLEPMQTIQSHVMSHIKSWHASNASHQIIGLLLSR